jgi:hypothetical protein
MLIPNVFPMVVMRVAPHILMMSDGLLSCLLSFSPFWFFSAKGEKEVEFYFVGFCVSHMSHILCLFVFIDMCTQLLGLVLCWISLCYFIVIEGLMVRCWPPSWEP